MLLIDEDVSLEGSGADFRLASEDSSLRWRPSSLLNCCPLRPGSAFRNSDGSLASDSKSTVSLHLLGQGGVLRYSVSKSMDWKNLCCLMEG